MLHNISAKISVPPWWTDILLKYPYIEDSTLSVSVSDYVKFYVSQVYSDLKTMMWFLNTCLILYNNNLRKPVHYGDDWLLSISN